MNQREIGSTGIICSEVGLGTWAFASSIYGSVQKSDALAAVDAALENGITLFDTAPLYGNRKEDGISETILGEALGSRRKSVLISTKFGRYSTENAAGRFDAQRARESVEGSLRRLKTDYLDILFFHSPFSADEIADDVWAELDRLRSEGKIRLVGHSISMFEETAPMAKTWASERKIDLVQVVYSLMNRESAALIDTLAKIGTGVFARESLANGFLSGSIRPDTIFPEGSLNARYSREEIAARAKYAADLGFLVREDIKTLPQAAARWVLDNPGVSLVLAGAKNPAELSDWIAASTAASFTAAEHERANAMHLRDFSAA